MKKMIPFFKKNIKKNKKYVIISILGTNLFIKGGLSWLQKMKN